MHVEKTGGRDDVRIQVFGKYEACHVKSKAFPVKKSKTKHLGSLTYIYVRDTNLVVSTGLRQRPFTILCTFFLKCVFYLRICVYFTSEFAA